MDKQSSLNAEQASRVSLFMQQLRIFPVVYLIMMPVTLYFFGASLIAIPIYTALVLLAKAWFSKRLLGSTDPGRPYETTSDTD